MRVRVHPVRSVALAAAVLAASLLAAPAQARTADQDLTAGRTADAATGLTDEESHALSTRLQALLPASRVEAALQRFGLAGDELSGGLDLIDPADYRCGSTPVRDWLSATTADWTVVDQNDARVLMLFPLLDALLYGPTSPQTFGRDDEFATPVTHTFRDLGGFWDIPAAEIALVGMHGDVLRDRARLEHLTRVGLGYGDPVAPLLADLVHAIANQEKFDFGAHPYLTFNAFALDGGVELVPGLGITPDEIIMGDGILEAYRAIGLGDVAPQAILAHEYGHQVQYAKGLTGTTLTGAEAGRRLELMADGLAAYFLTHARGAAMNAKRVRDFEATFFNVGDCNFALTAHHGTPDQRTRAAEWGFGVADAARPQGHILPGAQFGRLFEQKLPELVAPDAD